MVALERFAPVAAHHMMDDPYVYNDTREIITGAIKVAGGSAAWIPSQAALRAGVRRELQVSTCWRVPGCRLMRSWFAR